MQNLVPTSTAGKGKGQPLRGDYTVEIMTDILDHFGQNTRQKASDRRSKSPPRPKDLMESAELVPMFVTDITKTTPRKTPARSCTNDVSPRMSYKTLLDMVAEELHRRLGAAKGHVRLICEWMSKQQNWSRIVKETRENFELCGSRVMYKNSEQE